MNKSLPLDTNYYPLLDIENTLYTGLEILNGDLLVDLAYKILQGSLVI